MTLTFPDSPSPRQSKQRLFRYLQQLSGQYVWRLDISKKGSIHYHLLYWGTESDEELGMKWRRLQPVDTPYLFDCKKGKKKILYFMKKRLFQKEAKEMDNAGRFWGHSRNLNTDPKAQLSLSKGETAFCLRLLKRWRKVKTNGDLQDVWYFGNSDECEAIYNRLCEIIKLLRKGEHIPDELYKNPTLKKRKKAVRLTKRKLRMVAV